ncbi:hypothetical protein [Pantoea hericii]|uniref:hypothetical protein n=1 Tax=Pantoea hericii TaxID=1815628 RepID=UPI00215931E9|nr:hypothetical protein [Pantoea hericii]
MTDMLCGKRRQYSESQDFAIQRAAGSYRLFLTATLFQEEHMPEYCFFKKGRQITVLERNDSAGAAELSQRGYEKQFEEVTAPDENRALARFHDIRNEDQQSANAFARGEVFAILTVGLLSVAGWLIFK